MTASVATKKKDIGAKRFLCTRMTFSQTESVNDGDSRRVEIGLQWVRHFIDTGITYYCDVLLYNKG